MRHKNKHNIWKKVIAAGMVCLFLFNQMTWAYPEYHTVSDNRTLATNSMLPDEIGGSAQEEEVIMRRCRRIMEKSRDRLCDPEEIITVHFAYVQFALRKGLITTAEYYGFMVRQAGFEEQANLPKEDRYAAEFAEAFRQRLADEKDMMAGSPEGTPFSEPRLSGNDPYSRCLQRLLENPTQASIDRRSALTRIGPVIERRIQEILGNEQIRIAIFPVGGTLRGYAQDDSDVECVICILSGEDSDIAEIRNPEASQIRDELNSLLRGRDYGYELDKLFGEAMPIVNFSRITSGDFAFSADSIEEVWAWDLDYLFLPMAYGDPALIEQARRNVVLSLAESGLDPELINRVWSRLSEQYSWSVSFDVESEIETIQQRDHILQWISRQRGDPSSRQGIVDFIVARANSLGLTTLTEMVDIYSPSSPTKEGGTASIDVLDMWIADVNAGGEHRDSALGNLIYHIERVRNDFPQGWGLGLIDYIATRLNQPARDEFLTRASTDEQRRFIEVVCAKTPEAQGYEEARGLWSLNEVATRYRSDGARCELGHPIKWEMVIAKADGTTIVLGPDDVVSLGFVESDNDVKRIQDAKRREKYLYILRRKKRSLY